MFSEKVPLVIAARNLSDYVLCGKPVPPGHEMMPCSGCQSVVIVSPEAARTFRAARNPAKYLFCSPCLMKYVPPERAEIHETEHGKKVGAKALWEKRVRNAKAD